MNLNVFLITQNADTGDTPSNSINDTDSWEASISAISIRNKLWEAETEYLNENLDEKSGELEEKFHEISDYEYDTESSSSTLKLNKKFKLF